MAMRIVVTGCAGFIGSQLTARLLQRQDLPFKVSAVRGLDNFDQTLYPAHLHQARLETLWAPHFHFVKGDLLDEGALAETLADLGPEDVVVHLAALAGVRPSLTQAERYLRVNVEGTQRLLSACQARGVARVVFASSSSVYGSRSVVPFAEDDVAVTPASPYAASKRAAELLCTTHAALYGTSIAALRFFTVYGPHQRPEMAIAKFARLIASGQKVPLFGDGLAARDYTYIDDIVDGIVGAIARTKDPQLGFRIYNLGGAQVTTLLQLVALLETALQRTALVDWQPSQPGDVPLTCADVRRAEAELGYFPKVLMQEGLDRYCRWLLTPGNLPQ
jgi:UDP-glucuronate 4-epimerase